MEQTRFIFFVELYWVGCGKGSVWLLVFVRFNGKVNYKQQQKR